MTVPFSRAVSSAASLMTLARSAPDMPTVRLASPSRSASGAIGLPCECTRSTARRPARSGLDTGICRSKRPGRSSAGSRMSGRLVAAIRMTPWRVAEAVHLDEQLVQRLLALVVAAAEAGAALAADRVDLVDEDDAGAVLLGLLEQVAHPGGADADEHLDEVRTGDREERHARLARDGARQQRLAGAGRAVEQHALGDLGAERLVARRVLQEVLDLVELLDRLVDAGDVGERRLRHVLVQLLGLRLAEAEAHPAAALHAGEHHEQADQQQQRQQVDQQRAERCCPG